MCSGGWGLIRDTDSPEACCTVWNLAVKIKQPPLNSNENFSVPAVARLVKPGENN